jgi:hypothetical protein
MVIDRNEAQIRILDQVRAFLDGSLAVEFKALGDDECRHRQNRYVLRRLSYAGLGRADRGRC